MDPQSSNAEQPSPWGQANERARVYASAARTYWVSRPSWPQRVIAGAAGLVLLGLLVIVLACALIVGSVFALVFFVALGVQRLVDAVLGRSGARRPGGSLRRNVRVIGPDGR